MNNHSISDPFLNLKEVLKIIPVSQSNWYAGVASGRFPPPIKIGCRSFWPQSVIENYISTLNSQGGACHE
jgi:predicted DNA-binding transcriptional regulator AlpA